MDDEVPGQSAPTSKGSVLVLLFVPSRDAAGAEIDQIFWIEESLKEFARLFGGATSFPKGPSAWVDDNGTLLIEETVILFSLAAPNDITRPALRALLAHAQRFRREANQAVVGLMIGTRYYPVRS